jgi:hypothetical protein
MVPEESAVVVLWGPDACAPAVDAMMSPLSGKTKQMQGVGVLEEFQQV